MALWNRLGVWFGGAASRVVGIQSGAPSRYAEASSVPVTIDSALQVSACWACVKLIAETIGSLPIKIYDVKPDGTRIENRTHPLAILFNGKPNLWQTRQEFFETITYQLAMLGNNYVVKQYGTDGKKIIGLIPLMSEQMETSLQPDGTLLYRYLDGKNMNIYAQQTIWQNKLFGNGVIGLSPMSYARNSLGIAQAAESAVSKIYRNGGKPSGVLSIDKVLTEAQREAVKKNFAEMAEGNQDRLFVLEAGMKYQQVSLSPQDIELLASRRFQIEDIARFHGVPSVLINDTSASTSWGSGIQQIVEGWYKLGLRPILTRYQDSMKANLLTFLEQQTMDIEFDFEALLAPDRTARITNGKNAVQGSLLTPNEWRKDEGLPPMSGGDKLLAQQQMVPVDKLETIQRGGAANAQPQNDGKDNQGA